MVKKYYKKQKETQQEPKPPDIGYFVSRPFLTQKQNHQVQDSFAAILDLMIDKQDRSSLSSKHDKDAQKMIIEDLLNHKKGEFSIIMVNYELQKGNISDVLSDIYKSNGQNIVVVKNIVIDLMYRYQGLKCQDPWLQQKYKYLSYLILNEFLKWMENWELVNVKNIG